VGRNSWSNRKPKAIRRWAADGGLRLDDALHRRQYHPAISRARPTRPEAAAPVVGPSARRSGLHGRLLPAVSFCLGSRVSRHRCSRAANPSGRRRRLELVEPDLDRATALSCPTINFARRVASVAMREKTSRSQQIRLAAELPGKRRTRIPISKATIVPRPSLVPRRRVPARRCPGQRFVGTRAAKRRGIRRGVVAAPPGTGSSTPSAQGESQLKPVPTPVHTRTVSRQPVKHSKRPRRPRGKRGESACEGAEDGGKRKKRAAAACKSKFD